MMCRILKYNILKIIVNGVLYMCLSYLISIALKLLLSLDLDCAAKIVRGYVLTYLFVPVPMEYTQYVNSMQQYGRMPAEMALGAYEIVATKEYCRVPY